MSDDVFNQLNNAVLDLQSAEYQTYERPLKRLGKLLCDSSFKAANEELVANVDLDAFLKESASHTRGMIGGDQLNWPDDAEQTLGLTWLLIQKLAGDESFAFQFSHRYFSSGSSKVIAGLRSMTGQMIVPFVRDYVGYVKKKHSVRGQSTDLASFDTGKSANEVFIVHGHDDAALQGLARFVEQIGLRAIVLKEKPDQGRTIPRTNDCRKV